MLRWFTPKKEVALCGHGTIAAAAALWMGEDNSNGGLFFDTVRSGQSAKVENGMLAEPWKLRARFVRHLALQTHFLKREVTPLCLLSLTQLRDCRGRQHQLSVPFHKCQGAGADATRLAPWAQVHSGELSVSRGSADDERPVMHMNLPLRAPADTVPAGITADSELVAVSKVAVA